MGSRPVASFTVTKWAWLREHEPAIANLILRQGLWKGGIGVVLGLIGAALLSRSMTTLLFNVKPTEPTVYAAVSFVLIAVALLASYLPARRAARIDPLIALREE